MTDLALTVEEGVATVVFDRPACLNAFRRRTYAELREIAERMQREETWRAVVFTGAGRAFCAGQDLTEVSNGHASADDVAHAIDDIQAITRAIVNSSVPTVCAIKGPAVGFGLEVTLACDLRIASPDAYFMLPELSHGLFHTNATYHLLPRLAGAGLAADMILTGRRVTATEAVGAGLVSRIAPADDLLATAQGAARQLAGLSRSVLALARRGLRDTAVRDGLEAALEFEASACLQLLASPAAKP